MWVNDCGHVGKLGPSHRGDLPQPMVGHVKRDMPGSYVYVGWENFDLFSYIKSTRGYNIYKVLWAQGS